MDLGAFRGSPVGELVPISGHDPARDRSYQHMAFVPHPLPASLPLRERTYKAVTEADRAVGRLDEAAARLPNPALLVRPALRREAVSTSALEGTYAALSEVLEGDFAEERDLSAEVREVQNYVTAAERGLRLIQDRPISLNLIAELQRLIVRRTRGDGYDAGRLRDRQVYIGEVRSGIEEARFVPPPPGDVLVRGVSDWEKWINAEDDVPLLVKAALGHYQFETLHPFSDGNGRLGRLVVTLYLVYSGALRYPILNLSPWLEPRRDDYIGHLEAVSRTGDFDAWVQFFCGAVTAQAQDGVSRIDDLLGVRAFFLDVLKGAGARGVVLDIAEDLIGYPYITPSRAAQLHGVTYPPANNAIQRLAGLGILREITGANYGRMYVCDAVMRIIERS